MADAQVPLPAPTNVTPATLTDLFRSTPVAPPVSNPDTLDALTQVFLNSASVRPEPTAQDKREAVYAGGKTGAVTGASLAASTWAGVRLGALTKSPYGVGTGAVTGFVTGLMGSDYLNTLLESDVPPKYFNDTRLVPYYQGGKTFTSSIATVPLTFGIPVMQGGRIAGFISQVGTTARAAPKATVFNETFTAAGAATAGGAMLSYDPEGEKKRAAAEMLGGAFTPPKLLFNTARNASGIYAALKNKYSKGSREYMAAEYMQQLLETGGEDPAKLIQRLLAPLPAGVPEPTGGQKTGSFMLQLLENTLGKENASFGSRIGPQGRATFDAFQVIINKLRGTGDPEALREAARLESDFFKGMLESRVATAEQNAALKISKIQVDSPESRQQIGKIVHEEMDNSVTDTRAYETGLWEAGEQESVVITVGKNGRRTVTPQMITVTNSHRGMLEALTSVPPEFIKAMPNYALVRDVAARFGIDEAAMETFENGKNTVSFITNKRVPPSFIEEAPELSVKQLLQYRSSLLSSARAVKNTDPNAARIYGEMADAIFEDMSTLNMPAYDRARQYSAELNDFFTRTYARDITATTATGARKLSPETLVARAFGSNTDVTSLRMTQAIDAVESLDTRYQRLLQQLGPNDPQVIELAPYAARAAKGASSMRDAQRQWLLLGANKALIPDSTHPSGVRLNQAALDKFIAENRNYLRDTGLLPDMMEVGKAEAALRTAISETSDLNTVAQKQEAFALLLGRDNPTTVLTTALKGDYPQKQIGSLFKLAKTGGTNAVEGLKYTLYDYAYTAAGGMGRNFSPSAYYDALFKPVAHNQPSLVQMATQSGAMTMLEKSNIKRLLVPMMQIENALANKQQLDAILNSGTGAIQEIMLRYTGSKLGRLGGGSGESLVLAGAGSRLLRDFFSKQPNILIREILQDAVTNPQLLAALLQKVQPGVNGANILRSLTAQLVIGGFTVAPTALAANPLQYEPPQEEVPDAPYASPYPQTPAPPTRGVPNNTAPAAAAPPPAATAPPQASAQSSSRDMYRQLFPLDMA